MCSQIRIRRKKADPQAVAKHLTAKQQKQLRKRGEITIDLPDDRRLQQRIRLDLDAVYVS